MQQCNVGRELIDVAFIKEGSSSNRPELTTFFMALRDTLIEEQLLYL